MVSLEDPDEQKEGSGRGLPSNSQYFLTAAYCSLLHTSQLSSEVSLSFCQISSLQSDMTYYTGLLGNILQCRSDAFSKQVERHWGSSKQLLAHFECPQEVRACAN